MDRTTLAWWIAGIVFAIAFITISAPHIAREEGPVSVFIGGILIGAVIVYGIIDHQRRKERAQRDFDDEQH
jgi:hypothetical protein